MNDDVRREKIREALDESFAYLNDRPSLQYEIMKKVKGEIKVKRKTPLSVAIAILMLLMALSAAYAEHQWKVFSNLSFMTGEDPILADEVMTSDLYQTTVNDVEITIKEAGYDGKTLFLMYTFRMKDVDKVFDEDGLTEEDESLLVKHDVGWWTDTIWFDGKAMGMPGGSGGMMVGDGVPGEMAKVEYWRLDQEDVQLSGEVEISLPIGERQSIGWIGDNPDAYDEDGMLRLPEKGVVTFTFNASDILDRVVTEHPCIKTVTPIVTAQATEVCYTPLMTYITLELEGNDEALEAYKAEHGEGYCDEDGTLLWPYSYMDVYGGWVSNLKLVDGEGKELFPGVYGCNGYGDKDAEFTYPYIENVPDELWLAPVENGVADMSRAVKVK